MLKTRESRRRTNKFPPVGASIIVDATAKFNRRRALNPGRVIDGGHSSPAAKSGVFTGWTRDASVIPHRSVARA
jgi:hypothetical protein